MKKTISVREPWGDTLIDHLLHHRGIITAEEREVFLHPDYDSHLHDPFLFKDMDKAVSRIEQAINDNERIVIYSDYDADGIPAAVILAHYFKDIGYENVEHYIPHRHDEGFGLHKEALDKIKVREAKLIITLDCGISDVEQAAYAKELGFDLIITDHHLPKQSVVVDGVSHDVLPEAYAIIDPKRADCEYPEKMLCGAGVGFKLVQALLKRDRRGVKEGREKWLLDMVGLATLSDMVPLRGENRVFAKYGLTVLQKSPRPGLVRLLLSLKVNQQHLNEDDVAFMITPRINVASRMGDPRDAFLLLSTVDFSEADRLVSSLNDLNDERKGSVAAIVKEIKNKIEKRHLEDVPLIVLGNPEWRPALLGLVATSLVRDYGKSAFLWGRAEDGTLKGSCRSEGVTDVVALMAAAQTSSQASAPDGGALFINHGGHAMSGGFGVDVEHIHLLPAALQDAFIVLSNGVKAADDLLMVDRVLTIDDVTWQTWSTVEKLAPYGAGNPKPLFMFEKVIPENVKMFGKAKDHLELTFMNSKGKKVSAIQFFTGDQHGLVAQQPVSFLATLEKSMFRNFPELRLRIVEVLS